MSLGRRQFAIASLVLVTGIGLAMGSEEHYPSTQTGVVAGSAAVTKGILVTIADERNGRVAVGDAAQSYRRRGHYGTSAWSEQIASQVAEKFGLKVIAQWPITALGLHCVVYDISDGQSVEAVLQALQRDERVETAQPVQSFNAMSQSRGLRSAN